MFRPAPSFRRGAFSWGCSSWGCDVYIRSSPRASIAHLPLQLHQHLLLPPTPTRTPIHRTFSFSFTTSNMIASQTAPSKRRLSNTKPLDKPIVDVLKAEQAKTKTAPLPKIEDVKLILSDVDGTLLDDDHYVHHRTRDAIRYLRKAHPEIPFIPVTGKQRVSCEYLVETCGLEDMPSACCHGSIIYNNEGMLESQVGIAPDVVVEVVAFLRRLNKSVMLYEHDSVACVALEERTDKDFFEISKGFDPSIFDKRGTDYMDRVARGDVVINKIFLPMDEEVTDDYMAKLAEHFPSRDAFRMTRALPYIIELIPSGANKGVALNHFSKVYNIAPENIITFGDGENDVPMFTLSGFPCAMGNAMAAPTEAAKYQTITNNEGGVGVFLDAIFRPDYKPAPVTDSGYNSATSDN